MLIKYAPIFLPLVLHFSLFRLKAILLCALSPFSIQEFSTSENNAIQINVTTHAETRPNYNWPLASSSNTQRVTHFSDGQKLNATLWLGGGVE